MTISQIHHKSSKTIDQEYQLVKAAQNNTAKFEVLYNRYYEAIFRFVYQRLDSKELAFDITQQVFVKALQGIKKYKFKGVPFSAWLYRIASNELNTSLKKNKLIRTINIESVTPHTLKEDIDEESLDDLWNILIEQIGTLAASEITLIEMRYMENRPFKEIADILDITENNAKVKVYRILDKLKAKCKTL